MTKQYLYHHTRNQSLNSLVLNIRMKTCSLCKLAKDQIEFNKNQHRCRNCSLAYMRDYVKSNKDKHKASVALAVSKFRNEKRELWNLQMAIVNARRKAALLKAIPRWIDDNLVNEQYAIAQAKTSESGVKWEVDHIIPLQSKIVCGLHVQSNLRVIPASENRIKSNTRWPDMP